MVPDTFDLPVSFLPPRLRADRLGAVKATSTLVPLKKREAGGQVPTRVAISDLVISHAVSKFKVARLNRVGTFQ